MIRLVHRRRWFQVRWKENQSQERQIYFLNEKLFIIMLLFILILLRAFSAWCWFYEQSDLWNVMWICNTKQSLSNLCKSLKELAH